jgi:hypothetical protein
MDQTRSNYTQDRSTNFKHHVPDDIAPPSAVTVQDYVQREKTKQMNRLRDWHLDSRDSVNTDSLALRNNFSSSRNYIDPSPIQELDHHKAYLIAGIALAVLATIVAGLVSMTH